MVAKVKIEGLEQLVMQLRNKRRTAVFTKLSVGFSAPYATVVHERLNVHHPRGQAKYLERATLEIQPEMVNIVKSTLQSFTLNVDRALTLAMKAAGDKLLARARELVPVDTGFLRASGYVKVEE